jgi:hypothetical protein
MLFLLFVLLLRPNLGKILSVFFPLFLSLPLQTVRTASPSLSYAATANKKEPQPQKKELVGETLVRKQALCVLASYYAIGSRRWRKYEPTNVQEAGIPESKKVDRNPLKDCSISDYRSEVRQESINSPLA